MKKEVSSAIKADLTTLVLVLPMLFFGDYTWSCSWIVGIALLIPWLNLLLDKYFIWWLLQYGIITALTFLPKGGYLLLLYWGITTVVLIIAGILSVYEYSQNGGYRK